MTRTSGRGLWAKPHLVLLAAALFAVPTLITLNLKHAGENGVGAENQLQSYISEMQVQNGLEWRIISGRVPQQVVSEEVAACRRRASEHLTESVAVGLSTVTAANITTLTRHYERAVDEDGAAQGGQGAGRPESGPDPGGPDVQPGDEVPGRADVTALDGGGQGPASGRCRSAGDRAAVAHAGQPRAEPSPACRGAQPGNASERGTLWNAHQQVVRPGPGGRPRRPSHLCEPFRRANSDVRRPGTKLGCGIGFGRRWTGRLPGRHRSRGPGTPSGGAADCLCRKQVDRRVSSGRQTRRRHARADGSGPDSRPLGGRARSDRARRHRPARTAPRAGAPGPARRADRAADRALLFDRFEQALLSATRSRTSVGLLLLDLERFKEVNDTFGHHYGDELLRQIGPRLADVLRSVDTIARLGGDEFAILLPDVQGVDAAIEVGTPLLANLAIPFHVEEVDLDVEASIGVVISGEHGQDVITLIQHADIAMYVAKTQHLGVFAYDPSVDGHSASKLAMVGDLRRALKCGERVLYYQPKVNISTGDLVGAEALARWQHPDDGLVLPDEFIPIAERTGLINPLTRHVLDSALAQARTWIDRGLPLPIAVNLSVRNLHDEHFAELVADLLAAHDVPARLLELEVTESAIMIDPGRARQMLEKLSALGVRLSLDDFGVGYTSLSQLKALPLSEIKIDHSFVRTMTQDRNDSLIVASVIALGHNLGLTLVAEGVEREDILAALAGFGCDVAQGFHLGGPMPITSFDIWRSSLARHAEDVGPRGLS